MKDTFEELRNTLSGDFYDDPLYTGIYATDASNYQIKPKAVICPRTEKDVEIVMKYAYEHHIPLLARGGGTSLVGQTVGEGFILDFTKYMNSILELNPEQKWAWVQPGLVRDDLNKQLSVQSLHFAPDPATSSRAAMGGMIANNSSGTRSIMYGKTLDHVLELKVMLDDGSVLLCKDVIGRELEQKLEMKSREGDLYRTLFRIVNENQAEIADKFPKVMRRVGGYNLDEFLGQTWNLSRLIVGSESTLAIILEAKINLVPNPKFQSVCVVHFHSFYDSIAHVREIVKFWSCCSRVT
jgi:FAD/FMN-containing dehydrogenase